MMDTPFTDLKIEIVQAGQVGGGSLRGLGGIFGACRSNGAQGSGQHAGSERDAQAFHGHNFCNGQ
jgi:hypothetical protein